MTVLVVALLASLIVIVPALSIKSENAGAASSAGLSQSASTNSSSTPLLDSEQIYSSTNMSIVLVRGAEVQNTPFGAQAVGILGSGFDITYSNSNYIVTNFHVAGTTANLTVRFPDGNEFPAKVIGSDPYSDLAIVSVQSAPNSEYHPLNLANSTSLRVGQEIAAIGNPFGLTGSMTVGIISQLGRTLQDPTAGNFSIANVIQFSAPINPGNSGGALLNAQGTVIGITTAVVSGSQGLGFAIPSNTITRELPSLVANGSYSGHSYLGMGGADMSYLLAKANGVNVTYGVLVENVVSGGPASNAGLRSGNTTINIEGQGFLIGGDIIVSINGTRIVNNDALSSYLEAFTSPGQVVSLGILRNGSPQTVNVVLGTRPSIS